MKQTGNNEIDLLLRNLARREGANSVLRDGVAKDQSPGVHLDADELNSYAEQVLPAATRARYTTHLADCARCRQIVSELTSAVGARVRGPLIEQKTSGAFRQRVSALLSPGVLRYAVPALALFAFIAVGLVALRQQSQPDLVAQNQPAASRDASIETKQAGSPAEPENSAAAIGERRSSESRTSAGKGRDNQAEAGERNEPSNNRKLADSVTITSDKDASPGRAAGVAAQPSYAPEPAAPPPPKPQTTHTEARTEVAARQKEEADKRDEPAREQEGARARTDDNQNQVALPQSARAGPVGQSQEKLRTLEAKRGNVARAKKTDDEVEIRSVSGRRFRREGNVWVDTSYQSSTATMNVARGSEQYRALVADEPGIRAIAEQLHGEVVVVWKGRAYRIR